MDDAGNPRFIAAHARDLSRRTRAESASLTSLMLRWAWPGGHDDRFDPVAVEWLRRWSPDIECVTPVACSCVEGRCAVCN